MPIGKKEKEELKKIASEIKRPHIFIVKLFWLVFAIYYGGVLRQKYQRWFTKKIKWSPGSLTFLNALILGLGGSFLYFYGRNDAFDFISRIFASEIANVFNITVKTTLDIYSGYNIVQSFARIFYVIKTKKAIASFNLWSAVLNLIHWLGQVFHKKIIKR